MSTVYRITELYNVLRPLRRTNNLITSTIRCICPLPQKIIRYSQHKFNSYKQKLYNSNINSTNLSIPARYNYEKYNKSTVSLPVFNKLFYPSIILTSFVFALYNNMNNSIIGISLLSLVGIGYYFNKIKKNNQENNNTSNTNNNSDINNNEMQILPTIDVISNTRLNNILELPSTDIILEEKNTELLINMADNTIKNTTEVIINDNDNININDNIPIDFNKITESDTNSDTSSEFEVIN